MNLQKHFSLNRFYKYLKYDLVLNGKIYLFFGIGMILALVLIQFYTLSTANTRVANFKNQYYKPIFYFALIIGILISVGTSFPALRKAKNSMNYLLLPTSNFEKLTVQFILRIVVFVMFFFLVYWITFKFAYSLYSLFEWEDYIMIEPYGLFSVFDSLPTILDKWAIVLTIFSLATFLFAGTVYFKKYALFKTIFSLSLLLVFCFLLMVLFSHIFYPNSSRDFFQVKLDNYSIDKNLRNTQFFTYIFGMASSLFLLPLAYFKFKEKEV